MSAPGSKLLPENTAEGFVGTDHSCLVGHTSSGVVICGLTGGSPGPQEWDSQRCNVKKDS